MELLCLFLCLWTLEILKKYQLIKAWQGRFLNKLAKVWYDIIWGMESSVVGQNWIQVKNCNWWFSISVMVSYPQFMNNCRGFGTKDIENKSRFKDFILTKQFCPVTNRYLHFCAFTTDSVTCTLFRDGSLFMGITGSGKNRTGFENFSCRGDGLCVFFLNKETGL